MDVSPLSLSPRSQSFSMLPSSRADRPAGEPYLRIQLTDGVSAVLAMQQIQEVQTLLAHHLTPMPNLPECVLGLMNRRSRVIWVIDLAQLLGLASLGANHQQYNLVIMRTGNLVLALAVARIHGFFWLSPELVSTDFEYLSPPLPAYVQGYTLAEQETVLVLNPEAILHSPALHASP